MLPAEATSELKTWVQTQLDEHELSMRAASLKAGLSPNRLQQVMAGDTPGIEVCTALAELFDVQLELILYLAGYNVKDPRQDYDAEVARFADYLQAKPLPLRKKSLRAIRSVVELGED